MYAMHYSVYNVEFKEYKYIGISEMFTKKCFCTEKCSQLTSRDLKNNNNNCCPVNFHEVFFFYYYFLRQYSEVPLENVCRAYLIRG